MLKNLSNKYKLWVENASWKTFFKIYFLATLYSLFACIYQADEFGFCAFFFPFEPLQLFIAPFLAILKLISISLEKSNYLLTSICTLIILAIIINAYHFTKIRTPFYKKAKKISQAVKLGLLSYIFLILIFYLGILITGTSCSAYTCGFLQGYY